MNRKMNNTDMLRRVNLVLYSSKHEYIKPKASRGHYRTVIKQRSTLYPINYVFIHEQRVFTIQRREWLLIMRGLYTHKDLVIPDGFGETVTNEKSNEKLLNGLKISQADITKMAESCKRLLDRTQKELIWTLRHPYPCGAFTITNNIFRDILNYRTENRQLLATLVTLPSTFYGELKHWLKREREFRYCREKIGFDAHFLRPVWSEMEQDRRQAKIAEYEVLEWWLQGVIAFLEEATDGILIRAELLETEREVG